jgi:hypothetical protein
MKSQPSQPTYSVVVRNPNAWTQDRDGSNREYEITAHCGHNHKTHEAAKQCMSKLTEWRCLCGKTANSYAPCCKTPRNSTSARWYKAHVEASDAITEF